jgi:hypothetical protein
MINRLPEIINRSIEVTDNKKAAEEGGCGVIGFIASVPVPGKHIIEPSVQMHNRATARAAASRRWGSLPVTWASRKKFWTATT